MTIKTTIREILDSSHRENVDEFGLVLFGN